MRTSARSEHSIAARSAIPLEASICVVEHKIWRVLTRLLPKGSVFWIPERHVQPHTKYCRNVFSFDRHCAYLVGSMKADTASMEATILAQLASASTIDNSGDFASKHG